MDLDALFQRRTSSVARALIGCTLRRGDRAGRIVEVEAYTDDAASHFVTRPSARELMGSTHGRVYLYRSHGVHVCLNFTTDAGGPGAVLIRAFEPLEGIELMRRERGRQDERELCNGPGKLVQAFGLSMELNALPIAEVFELEPPDGRPGIVAGPRIGISRDKALPWRFCLEGSRFLSRPAVGP